MTLIPQTKSKLENALREYEAVHKQWMNTPVWGEAGKSVARRLRESKDAYVAAYEAANPGTTILF